MAAIGNTAVDAIAMRDMEAILNRYGRRNPRPRGTSNKRIHAVLKWAVAYGHRTDNPVDAVDAILPKQNELKTHHRALHYADVPAAIATVRETGVNASTKLAFELMVLTATRSGEARGATWAEVDIDGDSPTWTIPAERMKAGVEHTVPLSPAAVEVLEAAAAEFGRDGLIFPSTKGTVTRDANMSNMLRENGIAAVPHGFQSSFRNWCAETGVERDVAEAALAHKVGGAVELAYKRTDYLEKRRAVMRKWAAHCVPKRARQSLQAA